MARLTSIARLRAPERMATLLLRGHDPGHLPDMQPSFASLQQQARAFGLHILDCSARYLAPDEIELLSWLTLFQQNPYFAGEIAPEALSESLRLCSDKLFHAGLRLHINATLRLKNPAAKLHMLIPVPTMKSERSFQRMPSPSSVQGRAIRHIAARGMADTRSLAELGFSRQLLSLMLQHGLVRRVGHGKYSVTPEIARTLEETQ